MALGLRWPCQLFQVNLSIISGEFVAQLKFTVLLMANGPMKITGLPFDETLFESEYSIEDEGLKVTGGRILFCCK